MTESDDNAAADGEQVPGGTGELGDELVPSASNETSDSEESEDDGQQMPFLDHLEELRWRILKALGAVLVGAIIAFTVSEQLLRILTHPYEDAVRSLLHAGDVGPVEAVTRLVERWFDTGVVDSPSAIRDPDEPLPLSRQLQGLKVMTHFFVQIQIALLGGFVFALPVVFYQFWKFVAPGLLTNEIRIFMPVIGLSVICFLIGVMIAYWLVLPLGLRFFLGLEPQGLPMTSQWSVTDYISFVLKLIFGFGIVFEMPVVSLFLSRIGLLTPEYLRRIRRYAVVAIFLMAAIFTPPDPISQLLMALPLLLLYEISIWVSRVSSKRVPATG